MKTTLARIRALVLALFALTGFTASTLAGPPGSYSVLGSTDLSAWSKLGNVTNELGTATFIDRSAPLSPQKFYRARFAP